jgi:YD repeat-containing protein
MNRTEYAYDLMSRVIAKTYKYVDPATTQWVTVVTKQCTYDKKGNVVKEQDALGIDGNYGTTYMYNLADKLVTVIDPVSEDRGLPYTTKYEYDALGRKISETNAKGAVTGYIYDDAGNVTQVAVNGQKIKSADLH